MVYYDLLYWFFLAHVRIIIISDVNTQNYCNVNPSSDNNITVWIVRVFGDSFFSSVQQSNARGRDDKARDSNGRWRDQYRRVIGSGGKVKKKKKDGIYNDLIIVRARPCNLFRKTKKHLIGQYFIDIAKSSPPPFCHANVIFARCHGDHVTQYTPRR